MATLIGPLGKEFSADEGDGDATRQFIVKADTISEPEPTIIAAVGIAYGAAHPADPSLFALGFSATQDKEAWFKWIVTVSYRSPTGGDTDSELNPLLRAPEIDYDTETFIFVSPGTVDQTTGTLTGVYANSAGEPYNPQPEEELEILVININRNEAANISVALFYQYAGVVNSNSFTFGDLTIPAGIAKLRPQISKSTEWRDPVTGVITYYRQVTYQIKLHPFGWDNVLADAGSYYLGDSSGTPKKPFLTDDVPPEPFIGFLNGSGGKLPDGSDPVFNDFGNKIRRSFTALALPAGP